MKIQLVTDQDYLPVLLGILSKAKKQIDIISYSFAIGSATGKLSQGGAPYQIALKIKEMKEKRGEDLKIRFFTEGLRETNLRNRVTAKLLKEAGVEVRYGSTHAKGFCIDQKIVLFGSTNLTNQSVTKNHEANLLMDGRKEAKEFLRYFEHLWEGGEHGDIALKKPYLADGDFKDDLIDLIARAKKKIDFSIYFFNQREIEKALIEAHERGVKIRGLIHEHGSFAMSYIWANRSTVKRLKAAGIKDLYFGRKTLFSHSKYLVVDGKEFSLGTGNWLEEDVHIHPQLYIHLNEPVIAKGLIQHLTMQIKKAGP